MEDWTQLASSTVLVGLPGPTLDADSRRRLRELEPAGIILFARNLDTPAQTSELITEAREQLSGPALIAIDQEGGRVSRLEPWIGSTPTAHELASRGEAETHRFAAATAHALRALGFNLDFAPVVDLCGPEAKNGIGSRSFGSEPRNVTRLAGAYLQGLQENGVAGCLKHFPGLGDTYVDSHVTRPTVRRERAGLEERELVPYRRLAHRAATVMVGHAHYLGVDPVGARPASLSTNVVRGLLRTLLGYGGVAVTDDLEMGAVRDLDREGQGAVSAIDAGCDLLLYCHDLDRAERAIVAVAARAKADATFNARLTEAAQRVRYLARLWLAPQPDLVAWHEAAPRLGDFRSNDSRLA